MNKENRLVRSQSEKIRYNNDKYRQNDPKLWKSFSNSINGDTKANNANDTLGVHLEDDSILERKVRFYGNFISKKFNHKCLEAIQTHMDLRDGVKTKLSLTSKGLHYGHKKKFFRKHVPAEFIAFSLIKDFYQTFENPRAMFVIASLNSHDDMVRVLTFKCKFDFDVNLFVSKYNIFFYKNALCSKVSSKKIDASKANSTSNKREISIKRSGSRDSVAESVELSRSTVSSTSLDTLQSEMEELAKEMKKLKLLIKKSKHDGDHTNQNMSNFNHNYANEMTDSQNTLVYDSNVSIHRINEAPSHIEHGLYEDISENLKDNWLLNRNVLNKADLIQVINKLEEDDCIGYQTKPNFIQSMPESLNSSPMLIKSNYYAKGGRPILSSRSLSRSSAEVSSPDDKVNVSYNDIQL